jgi:tetratricopeptide (TPR) repeat protein
MPPKELILNCSALKNRVTALGIKQWWLAEQVGVDRKTVIRWLQGKVKRIQHENAEALAQILQCEIEALCHSSEAENLASPEDQRQAATLLSTSALMERLGPIGEWDVVEGLLRATIVPDLPLAILGKLYNQLTVACWRQSKLDQATLFNEKAREVAEKCSDQNLRAEAFLSLGNLWSWKGKTRQAVQAYQEALSLKAHLEPKTIGSIYSNLGAVLYESGNLQAGLDFQEKAIRVFLLQGRPMNLSIAYCHEALIYLQMEDWEKAKWACEQSRLFAESDDYFRGREMANLIQAELLARKGLGSEAKQTAVDALGCFEKMGIKEGLNFEFAGRAFRLLGDYSNAEGYLQKGIEAAENYPVYLAALYMELAKVHLEAGHASDLADLALRRAIELYLYCEAPLRVEAAKALLSHGN